MSNDDETGMQTATATGRASGFAGDFEALFERYHSLVVGTAYRVTGNGEDAEDVLQTVFIRLLKHWDELQLSDRPAAYLRRAAVNASLDLLRARARAASIPLDDDTAPELEETGVASPDQHRLDAEMRRCLREALLGLSERSAQVFAMRYLEEIDNKEIASMLGMSQTAVAVMLHRARHHVREYLGEFIGGMDS